MDTNQRRPGHHADRIIFFLTLGSLLAQAARAQDGPAPDPPPVVGDVEEDVEGDIEEDDESWDDDLGDLGLEELMGIEVTSVAGVARPIRDTPAAIFVITDEDIRRGGHQTIADALRMVPGVQVGQVTSSVSAISVRGFNDRFSTKLLVTVDGRAVYNSLFSGVYWDVQDLMLDDVDRIEVVRGPGATLWGANAVNGVINVVTKKARRTQGLLLRGGGGSYEQGFGGFRYGGKAGEDTYFRLYGKYFNRDAYHVLGGSSASDDWDMFRGGFRIDFESDPDTTLTIQGDAYDGDVGSPTVLRTLSPPYAERSRIDQTVRGANVLGRIEHLSSPEAGWSLQAYFDYAKRDRPDFFEEERQTIDLEFRHHFEAGAHSIIWGAGYRRRDDDTDGSFTLSFEPDDDVLDKYSAFVQDTMTLAEDRLTLMVGSKFEHNDYTGFEIQPSARIAYTPDDRQILWGAVSRAVRTPSRATEDLRLTTAVVPPPITSEPTAARLTGTGGIEAEDLLAWELGYRVRPRAGLTFDVAGFYNVYDDLISITPVPGSPFDRTFSNRTDGESYGVEVSAKWAVSDHWRLSGSYSFLRVNLHGVDEADEDSSPRHQASLRSYLDLTDDVEFNTALYFVDNVPASDAASYMRFDAGLTWRPAPNVEVALWGQNLLDDRHLEFVDPFFVVEPIEVERGVYAQLSIRF